ncbi:bacteriophage spanin2 family protein [Pseudophaeobacter arcticus]|uniref:bacteriophage spanin2 family protein n=1 Tax=Pseudophaeobacter arcticus TaxID=385492 RepID=UPI0024932AF1|nr:bacteriophage spanin2 family protein [Pseudophaeobacter arcticus]
MNWQACTLGLLVLVSCGSPVGKLAGLAAGGPNVAANVQAGRTNAQTLGAAEFSDQRVTRSQARSIEQSAGRTGVRSESVETLIVREDPPAWLLLLALVGWLAPTPRQIGMATWSGARRMFLRVLPGG